MFIWLIFKVILASPILIFACAADDPIGFVVLPLTSLAIILLTKKKRLLLVPMISLILYLIWMFFHQPMYYRDIFGYGDPTDDMANYSWLFVIMMIPVHIIFSSVIALITHIIMRIRTKIKAKHSDKTTENQISE